MLKPFEFIKKPDRCCLITEYPNGPRISDILKIRKESGFVMQINASVPSFVDQEIKEPTESSHLDGFLSDPETRKVMRQVIDIVSDLYANKLCIYDLSPENFLTDFRHKIQLLADDMIVETTNSSEIGISERPKLRSNTILVTQTDQPNSLIEILADY